MIAIHYMCSSSVAGFFRANEQAVFMYVIDQLLWAQNPICESAFTRTAILCRINFPPTSAER